MGKIRIKDLATRMGIPSQDLVFKLKSIGARVEDEETKLDTDVIQAILQGKRLTQPREVILRDSEAPPMPVEPAPKGDRRAQPSRPGRRTMIQRVGSQQIRNLDADLGPAQVATSAPPARPAAPTQTVAADMPASGEDVAASEPVAESPKPAPAAHIITEPGTVETRPAGAPAAGKAAAGKAAAGKAAPGKAASGKAASGKAASGKAAAKQTPARAPGDKAAKGRVASDAPLRPSRSKARARLIARPDEAAPSVSTAPPPPPRRPPSSRPAPANPMPVRPSYGPRRRPRRPSRPGHQPIQDLRRYQRPRRPSGPPEELVEAKPSSARGHRRAERKQQRGDVVTSTELPSFKESRPEEPITISEGMTVREFAEKLGVKSKELIKSLVMRGVMANINHVLDPETAKSLGAELGVEVMEVSFEEEVQLQQEIDLGDQGQDAPKAMRAPVVTVMGHVDHGKTTLLDSIREADVAAGEAGGITQHIGAYHVDVGDKKVVFLDTPGHEAFTLMRARGAQVTDLVVLVVAADDGVMPQTIEAIDHAKAANVPLIVAVNKVDKNNANPDRVKKELADHQLMVEEWGGDVVSVPVSALKKQGIDDLLEMLLIQAELLELEASPSLPAQGAVLEARKDIGRGVIATVLVQDGTLNGGDIFVAGTSWGRVRSMVDDRGESIDAAGPATPIEVTGWNSLPSAGDMFQVVENENQARSITEFRSREERQRELAPRPSRMSLSQLFDRIEDGETKELALILKADVHGSAEVVRDTVEKLSTDKVKVKVIHSAVGAITTNDVILASASDAIVIGFNVRPERKAVQLAEKEEVELRMHTVIYELTEELKLAMAGLLDPVFEENITGAAEVRDTFKVPRFGSIAGCYVTEGVIPRNANARLLRDNRVVWEGAIGSLRRFKDDVSEVRNGFECGIGLEGYQDVKPGDVIEAYVRKEVAATLE